MRMFNFKSLLVPINFSSSSLNALETAVALCKQFGATLTVLQVVDSTRVIFPHNREAVPMPLLELMKVTCDNLKDLCESLRAKGIDCDYLAEAGVAAHVICSVALEKQFDLIVIGQEVKTFQNFLLGSTGYRVVKNSVCPVLSVPSSGRHINFRKIMFPVRNAPNMLEKYSLVRPIALRNGASIILAAVTSLFDEKALRRVSTLLDEVRNTVKQDDLSYITRIQFCDSISKEVLDLSKKEHADLIVITSMVMPSLKRFFLEHYTKNIVRHATCPVLSLRADA
jgi:nucleotide-binding universal stress UspA family protein